MADIVKIVEFFCVQIHCYADDVQLYIHCLATDAPIAVDRLRACIRAINNWMGSNKLKLNANNGTVIHPSTHVRTLGVILNNELIILPHANSVMRCNAVRGCFYHKIR